MIALDPETGEFVGPASAVQALLGREAVADLAVADLAVADLAVADLAVADLAVADEGFADEAVAAALAAARAPAFRVWTEGFEPAASVLGDGPLCVLVTDRPGGEQALLPTTTALLPVALVAWLGLGPRPLPDHPVIHLPPGAMAVLIGRAQAHGHDLDPAIARALQERLDAGVRHWTVRFERAGRRRNLEVVEGAAGAWRVRPVGELVELAPTTPTAVVRELIALLVEASATRESEPARGPMNADRPAIPSD